MKAAPATARALPYAARLACDGGHQHVAMQTRLPGDRRFELARMMGDAIWSRGSCFGVVSRARTDRQKFQRAFAQLSPCPYVDLRDHVDITEPTSKQIEQARDIIEFMRTSFVPSWSIKGCCRASRS